MVRRLVACPVWWGEVFGQGSGVRGPIHLRMLLVRAADSSPLLWYLVSPAFFWGKCGNSLHYLGKLVGQGSFSLG